MSIFNQVSVKRPSSNTFDLSHDRKFSATIGELTPILVQETVPGDTFTINSSQMLRFAPMVAPIMHKASVYTHFFFVPNRILWDKWEDFISGGEDGYANPTFPTLTPPTAGGDYLIKSGSLADYLGVPNGVITGTKLNALPFTAYNKIYNDYYRDQNLVQPLVDKATTGDLDKLDEFNFIQKRAWQHDYFTSALPWTQKGPEATIPLGTTAPVSLIDTPIQPMIVTDLVGTTPAPYTDLYSGTGPAGKLTNGNNVDQYVLDPNGQLEADLSTAAAASINELRRAFRLQEWLERNARGGSRYIEIIQSHFGVKSSDSRLQRPEFLGGSSTPVTISEVLQNSESGVASTDPTPQGNMAGHGVSVGQSNKVSYMCEEHGFIIGIMSVMPKSAYQQGLPKVFSKFDKFDYFWPSFANIGEQPILNQELYHDVTDNLNDDVFGYTPRYAEYKYIPSTVHGEMRTSLDFWHMGRIFANRPNLNEDFIECDATETDRVFAVSDQEKLYVYLHNNIKAKRPMPYFGVPTI